MLPSSSSDPLVVKFLSPVLENLLSFEKTVIVFNEAESDEVLADILVFLTEEGRRWDSLELPVLAEPLREPGARKYYPILTLILAATCSPGRGLFPS